MAIKPIKRYGLLTPTGVDPTVGNRMKALAGIADGVRGLAVGVGKAKAESEAPAEALREAREAIEEGRAVEKRGVLEFGSAQFNASLQNAYVNSKTLDFSQEVAKIAANNPADVVSFQKLVKEQENAILSGLDPQFYEQMKQEINAITASNLDVVVKNQTAKSAKEANALSVRAVNVTSEDLFRAANNGDSKAAEVLFSKIESLYASRVTDGQATVGEAQAGIQAAKAGMQAEFARHILKTKMDTSPTDAVNWIAQVDAGEAGDLTVSQQDALVKAMRSDLSEKLSLQDFSEKRNQQEKVKTQKVTAGNLLAGILKGEVSGADLELANSRTDINFSQYKTLSDTLNARGQGIDDYSLISEIQNIMITDPNLAETLVSKNANVRLTGDTALSLYSSIRDSVAQESILKTNEAVRMRKYLRDQIVISGPMGAIIPDQQAKQSNLIMVYDTRLLAGESPIEVMQDLMLAMPEIKGEKSFKQSLEDLENSAEELGESVYNQKYQELQDMQALTINYKEYKEALNDLIKGSKQ